MGMPYCHSFMWEHNRTVRRMSAGTCRAHSRAAGDPTIQRPTADEGQRFLKRPVSDIEDEDDEPNSDQNSVEHERMTLPLFVERINGLMNKTSFGERQVVSAC